MTLMKCTLSLVTLVLSSYLFTLPAAVIYVNQFATGNNTGLTWPDAYRDLQTALAIAEAGDEIWVAGGDYKPTTVADRQATFEVPPGVAVYGGFAGTETSLAERDWTTFPTFLNGDIGIPGDHRDNSYTVITIMDPDARNILDGFDIRNGAANNQEIGTPAYDPARIGGGLLISTSAKDHDYQLTVRNIRFFNNYAEAGGAVYGDARERNNIGIAFINCTFELNQAGNGGAFMTGLGNTGPGGIRFTDCTFFNNSAINRGILHILTDTEQAGLVEIANCAFLENERNLIYVRNTAADHLLSVRVSGSTFRSNNSDNDGFNLFSISSRTLHLTLDSLTFRGNKGYNQLIGLGEPDTVLLRESIFVGNEVITLMEGRPRFFLAEHCQISQNKLQSSGIRMEGIDLRVQDCLLEANESRSLLELNEDRAGGPVYEEGAYSELLNCLLRDNIAETTIRMGGDSLLVESLEVIDSETAGQGELEFSARKSTVVNSLFIRPTIMDNKGALYNSISESELNFINCTFFNYVDSEYGALLFREQPLEDADTVQIRFHNSILWDELEAGHPLFRLQNAKLSLAHSLLQANDCDTLYRAEPTYYGSILPAAVICETGNLYGLAPRFKGVEKEDFSLQACSPAVNAGQLSFLPPGLTRDLSGSNRMVHGAVDLGAYEYQGDFPVLQVEADIVAASGPLEADGQITIDPLAEATPGYTYQWNTGDTTKLITGLIPGAYTLTLTDGNGCTESFTFTVDFTNKIVDPLQEWGASLFPNPVRTSQVGSLQLPDNEKSIRTLRLFTFQQQLLWEKEYRANEPIQDLPSPPMSGMYLLELVDRSGRRGYLRWLVQ